jgi:NADH-ubiquinone oxidoreductase chain 6
MNHLLIIFETYTNGYKVEMLDIISLLAILCGILVIINKNPIVSVLFLIGLFASISGYLIIVGISFIGLSYLIVYIGAISILFLFILMLINIRISELQSSSSNSVLLGIFIAISFNYPVFQLLPFTIIYNYNFILNKISLYFNYEKSVLNLYNHDFNYEKPVLNLYNHDLNFVTSNI